MGENLKGMGVVVDDPEDFTVKENVVDLQTTVIGAYPKPAYLKIPDFFNTGGDQKAGLLGASLKAYSELMASQTDESKEQLGKDIIRASTEVIAKQCQCGVD